jgi:hypothetical protein
VSSVVDNLKKVVTAVRSAFRATGNPSFGIWDGVLVKSQFGEPEEKVPLATIREWIDHDDPWIYWVTLRLEDGRTLRWKDPACELESLLYAAIPEKARREKNA